MWLGRADELIGQAWPLPLLTDAVEKVAEETLWNRNAQRSNPTGRFLEST